ncbi:MAG: hypothetical protein ACYSR8_10945, partial [Planctomycetota bacterium]
MADYIGTHDSSTLNFFGGEAELQAMDSSFINIYGGTLKSTGAHNYATVNFYGDAHVRAVDSRDFGAINICAGIVEMVGALNSGTVNLYGGSVTNEIYVDDLGQVNVYGHDLIKTNSGGAYGYGQVWGYLTDDTYISVNLTNLYAYSHINLIEVVDAEVKIRPRTLNLSNKGKWVICEVFIPED